MLTDRITGAIFCLFKVINSLVETSNVLFDEINAVKHARCWQVLLIPANLPEGTSSCFAFKNAGTKNLNAVENRCMMRSEQAEEGNKLVLGGRNTSKGSMSTDVTWSDYDLFYRTPVL